MLVGERVYRIHWIAGTDTLLGVCHCGAQRTAEEPVELWDWLLAHPAGHSPLTSDIPSQRLESLV